MALLLVALMVAVTSSGVLSKCPNVKPMADFQDSDLVGEWYLLAQTNRSGASAGYTRQHCQTMSAKEALKVWTLDFTGVDARNGTAYNFKAVGPESRKAYLNLAMYCPDTKQVYRHDITILGSDKKDFIILFSCEFPNPNVGYLWIYSRTKRINLTQLSNSEQLAISKVLSDNNFSSFELDVVDNSACS